MIFRRRRIGPTFKESSPQLVGRNALGRREDGHAEQYIAQTMLKPRRFTEELNRFELASRVMMTLGCLHDEASFAWTDRTRRQ